MKNAILGSLLFLSITYALLIISMQNTEQIKIQELNSVANLSIENGIAVIHNNDEITETEVKQVLFDTAQQRFKSKGSLKVDILTLDVENKVLKVRYTSKWTGANGKEKTKTVIKSMIVDQQKGV